ncbi:MAG: DUF2813 domain-containing protein [Methanomassiliicoccales archaeon]|nr:MAG: DUF2813 domain-containing protein [Methanomassiliicoccales archaeon]
MIIKKVEIQNFRSHKNTLVDLSATNVLIGENNTGKTTFLDAINHAIGDIRRSPMEDDFYASGENFDPEKSDPIKVILEFREEKDNRFSENVLYIFDKAIRFDEVQCPEDPIKFVRVCYEYRYDVDKEGFVENRYFVDKGNIKLSADSAVRRNHMSFFPFYYLTSSRDINREIRNKSSFWGKLKKSIDYKEKENDIRAMIEQIDDLILKDDETVDDLVLKLKELEKSMKLTSDSLHLHAFARRNWELLDDLNIYLKTANSNLALPINKHGMGTQNIAVLIIFNAYLDILLPKIVDNPEATPIIGIEEPEAHIHPQAQRAVFQQISRMKGQRIISTHSPFIVDQADIHDYLVFKAQKGITVIKRIPEYKKSFEFKYGLPNAAYESNRYLLPDERLLIERFIQHRNAELFFSSLFVLCEGDCERVFLERVFPYHVGQTSGQLGISVVGCEGGTYSPFLKIANMDAFDLTWRILSDGEDNTKVALKKTIVKSGYDLAKTQDRIHYLPNGCDFESYCIDVYGNEIDKVITEKFKGKFDKFCGQPVNSSLSGKELTNKFLDTIKVRFSEELAAHVIDQKLNVPGVVKDLMDAALSEVEE